MWKPWIGKNYYEKRILILGESSYAYREHADGPVLTPKNDHPIQMVLGQLDVDADDSAFMSTITNALTNKDCNSAEKRRIGWDQVAFTNYVPITIGTEARQRPSKDDWQLARDEWYSLMELLLPNNVIVLGLANWDNIPKGIPVFDENYSIKNRTPSIEQFLLKNGHSVTCWCHMHPAAGASWKSISRLFNYLKDK